MSNTTQIETIELSGTKKGTISIANIENPYGENTATVTSIGISLVGDEVEWKVHIPKENLEQVIQALQKAK
ncbi:MAG: hypothetical protein U9Q20_06105 [Campylobacterota bacterium]|nr:hypothetical protein [Campylobacterota bacterium]